MIDVPPEHGLYASCLCVAVYFLFGTSREAALGPTAVLALVIASATKDVASEEERFAMIAASTFIAGIAQLLMGLFQLGFVVTFISHAAISGFCSGAAFAIITQQSTAVLGSTYKATGLFFQDIAKIFSLLPELGLPNADFIIGISAIIAIFALKEVKRFAPNSKALGYFVSCRNVVVLFITTAISMIIAHNSGKEGAEGIPFRVIGFIPSKLPVPHFPTGLTKDIFTNSITPGILIAMVGFVEAYAISSSFPYSGKGTRVDASQELVTFGIANTITSLFKGFAVTASFSRSAVNASTGVQTQMHNIFTCGLIVTSLLFFTDLLFYVPSAVLAGVIIVGMTSIVDYDVLFTYYNLGWRASIYDAIVTGAAFFGVLAFGIEDGILLGVAIHSVIMLYRLSRPSIRSEIIVRDEEQGLIIDTNTLSNTSKLSKGPLRILRISIEGNLYYLSASRLDSAIKNISRISAKDQNTDSHTVSTITSDQFRVNSVGSIASIADHDNNNNDNDTDADNHVGNDQPFFASSAAALGAGSIIGGQSEIVSDLPVTSSLARVLLKHTSDSEQTFKILAEEEGVDSITHKLLAEQQGMQGMSMSSSEEQLPSQSRSPFVGIIIDLTKVSSIDSTGLHAIESACVHLLQNPVVLSNSNAPFVVSTIYFVGASPKILSIMKESHVLQSLQLGFSLLSTEKKFVKTVEHALDSIDRDVVIFEKKMKQALEMDSLLNVNSVADGDAATTPLLSLNGDDTSNEATKKSFFNRTPSKPTISELLSQIHTNEGHWA